MIRRSLLAFVSVATGLLIGQQAYAQVDCVRGRCVTVNVGATKRAQLRQAASQLAAAGVPGYGVLYKTAPGKQPFQGAMLVSAVERNTPAMESWYNTVGKRSIGFIASVGPDGSSGSGSGYLRIGGEFMSYNWVRGGGGNWGSSTEDIRQHYGTLTEATFLVSEPELAAFKAFYYARSKSLIKDSGGQAISPEWVNPGKCDLTQEGCAGAASSGLNPAWVTAFKRNLAELKAYGRANNIQALANAPDNAADIMRSFLSRTGARQQADPRALVRLHGPSADMLTLFNAGVGADPMQSLKWNRAVQWYVKPSWSPNAGQRVRDRNFKSWTGMGSPYTILDNPNGETHKSFSSERMTLNDFARTL